MILENYITGYWPLQIPFTWNLGVTLMASTSQAQPIDTSELSNLVHSQQRDISIGSRISHNVEARWQGNLLELQVGMLVATLAEDDELRRPFWIAKILEILKDDEGNKIDSIMVHWYHTSSLDAFIGKYNLEMVKEVGGRSRK